tara:strand:- start:2855 stop:3475 length:621 start_codon:yes stop_codon:yes gene_type:complete
MLRKIKLYGELAKFLGQRTFEAEVNNAAQAVRFLVTNFPTVEKYMSDKYYKVIINDWELEEKELHYPTGQSDIKIVPVITGAGGASGRQILFGAILIGASFMFPGAGMFGHTGLFGAGPAVTGGFFTKMGTMVSAMGASMILSGIDQMLTPTPPVPEDSQDPRKSFNFSGIQNTSRAGVAVPIHYGRVITGSITVSANIENEQVEV